MSNAGPRQSLQTKTPRSTKILKVRGVPGLVQAREPRAAFLQWDLLRRPSLGGLGAPGGLRVFHQPPPTPQCEQQ